MVLARVTRSTTDGVSQIKRYRNESENEISQFTAPKRIKTSVDALKKSKSNDKDPDVALFSTSTAKAKVSRRKSAKLTFDNGDDVDPVDLTEKPSRFSKSQAQAVSDEQQDEADDEVAAASKKGGKKKGKAPDEEKRLKRFRDKAPGTYWEIHNRAITQRMFVIERTRSGSEECPEEVVELAGTTGNIYNVHVKKVPSCDCPHAAKGNQCKHIIYVMCKVLRAPENLQYQLALLSSELREIFAHAPPILSEDNTSRDGNRKPVEGDCPICCTDFEPDDLLVWCKAACGNNVHKECFGQWAATRKGHPGGVTCPFCRTPWVGDEDMLKNIAKSGIKNAEGYVNVAAELGISGQRDYSTYHRFWVRKQQREGLDVGDWVDPNPPWGRRYDDYYDGY